MPTPPGHLGSPQACFRVPGMLTILLHLGNFQLAELGNFQLARIGEFSTGDDTCNARRRLLEPARAQAQRSAA